MRLALFIGLVFVVCAGCSSNRPGGPNQTPTQAGTRTNAPVLVNPATTAPATGRIARVNPEAKFVIVSYPLGKVPAIGRRLAVYRDGMKVGELRVTEPQYQQHTAADIMAGEAQAGDEAREN